MTFKFSKIFLVLPLVLVACGGNYASEERVGVLEGNLNKLDRVAASRIVALDAKAASLSQTLAAQRDELNELRLKLATQESNMANLRNDSSSDQAQVIAGMQNSLNDLSLRIDNGLNELRQLLNAIQVVAATAPADANSDQGAEPKVITNNITRQIVITTPSAAANKDDLLTYYTMGTTLGLNKKPVVKRALNKYVVDREYVKMQLLYLANVAQKPNFFADAKTGGLKIMKIVPSTLFGKLGLMNGDIILSINNIPVPSSEDLLEIIKNCKDDTVVVEIKRLKPSKKMVLTYELK